MDTLRREARHALRGLARSPGSAPATLLTLGIGIGANTTVLAWLDTIVPHPLPGIPHGGELVALNVADVNGPIVTSLLRAPWPTCRAVRWDPVSELKAP